MLALTFSNPADYDKVQPHDTVDLLGVESMAPESKITMVAHHSDGSEDKIELSHSYNEGQLVRRRSSPAHADSEAEVVPCGLGAELDGCERGEELTCWRS